MKKELTTETGEMFANRLQKVFAPLSQQAQRLGLTAFRVYNSEIPEFPMIVEKFGDHAVIWTRYHDDEDDRGRTDIAVRACSTVMGVAGAHIHVKRRRRSPRATSSASQLPTWQRKRSTALVREGALQFEVEFERNTDVGLFLDSRLMRSRIASFVEKRRPSQRAVSFLNLFCYTGAASVAAAKAGATVTSVDLSPRFLEWAERNFVLNGLTPSRHEFVSADAALWTKKLDQNFDVILLDPPTFSNSARTNEDFDLQRDHAQLLETLRKRLNPQGVLFFMTNRRKFSPDGILNENYSREISAETIPFDFQRVCPHRSWQITGA